MEKAMKKNRLKRMQNAMERLQRQIKFLEKNSFGHNKILLRDKKYELENLMRNMRNELS